MQVKVHKTVHQNAATCDQRAHVEGTREMPLFGLDSRDRLAEQQYQEAKRTKLSLIHI